MTQQPRPWHKKRLSIIGTLITFPLLGIPLPWQQSDNASPEVAQAVEAKPKLQEEVDIEAISDQATLWASDPKSRINLRATPSYDGKLRGYGLVGDRVQVTAVAIAVDDSWYLVKFPRSGATGWIHAAFVILDHSR